ncbi:MAG: hypothetical protein HY301_07630 [Verrucomicrobia bacterium]|nr:hypothetical protein [Verrucomicrobiota bacterium]
MNWNSVETNFNYGEAGLWFVVSLVLFARSRRQPETPRKLGAIAAVAFFCFGISDLIEAQTGAWWEPIWLFFFKAACVLVFGACGWKYRVWLKEQKPPAD